MSCPFLSAHHNGAALDVPDLAGDRAGLRRAQEQNRRRDFARRGGSIQTADYATAAARHLVVKLVCKSDLCPACEPSSVPTQ